MVLIILLGMITVTACQTNESATPIADEAINLTESATNTPARASATPQATKTQRPTRTPVPTQEAVSPTAPAPTMTATLIPTPSLTPTLLPTPTATIPLVINAFQATTEDHDPAGKDITFTWSVSGAALIRIYSGTNQYFAKSWDVTAFNNIYILPLGRTMFRNPTMTMIATDGRGDIAVETIVVPWKCEFEYFFTPVPSQCPWHEESYSNATEQQFENGRMIWIQRVRQDNEFRENRIYVFVDPNHDGIGNWQRFDDIVPGEDNFTEAPPEGLQEPQSGFGEIWRQNNALRRDIGWALAGEASFETTWQYQLTEAGTAAAYVRTIDGRIIELFGSRTGGWRYIAPEE